MTKTKLLLILIILLAFFLRVYKLGDIPVSLYMDEASVGYDAFLISTSGKDQWGQSWPLVFKSFGEYKYPWQIYTALLSGFIWGWSEFSIRFPSAIFGTVNVLLLYFITKLISGKKSVGLFAALLLAVSPWHIQFTRMAWESAYVLLFLYIGIYLFVRGIKETGFWLPLGTFFMGLSMFAYNSAKIVTPLLFMWTILVYQKDFRQKQMWLIVAGFVLLLFFSINFLGNSFSGLERFNQVGIAEGVVRETWLFRQTHNYWMGWVILLFIEFKERF
jgi:4-amino-4-deoxy-L-arabinose transferase-like glycosyltransferase